MKITRFEDIEAWQTARIFTREIYEASREPRFRVDTDLTRQLRRAAVSTMSNIAEGFDSGSDPEFRRFLRIATRSASETQSGLYVALDQGCLPGSRIQALLDRGTEVKRLALGFVRYLNQGLL